MKQIVFIHGGEAYSDFQDYEIALEQAQVSLEYVEKKRWHYVPSLQQALGSEWQVIRPEMPNSNNAKYAHWKLWFEKYIPYMQDEVILVGHSLGAMFLSRYLSENIFPVKIEKLFLMAGEFTRRASKQPGEEDGEFFYTHLNNFAQLDKTARQLYLVHSKDDPVVPFENMAKFAEQLPSAQLITFTDKGHFWDEQFPELIEFIIQDLRVK